MHVPYTLAFTLDGAPMLPNRLQRQHWTRVSAHAKTWHWRVRVAIGRDRPEQPLTRARVELVRHSSRTPDEDNLVSSWKPVIDALVRSKVLVDDKPENMILVTRWERSKGPSWIGVGVMEVNDE